MGKKALAVVILLVAIGVSVANSRSDSLAIKLLTQTPSPDISSPDIPVDVAIPAGFGGNPIQFFDDYSWKAFVALMWPVQDGQRGLPDTTKDLSDNISPRVFETYKAPWEVFHGDGSAPATWNVYDKPQFNACNVQPKFGDLDIASMSPITDFGQAGPGDLVGPIASQNKQYVRYLAGFNEILFNDIAQRKLYLASNLTGTITLPNGSTASKINGSITVKSAWIDMSGVPNPTRYYTRQAMVWDFAQNKCVTKTVGLVGLHIVQKTPSRPQWIWTSFEQIDNVPPAAVGAPGTFALNDGTSAAMPARNPNSLNPPTLPPGVFNIIRIIPINPSTQQTNAAYQALLKAKGSKLQFYQLVMTQWPVPPPGSTTVPPSQDGKPANTFPGTSFSGSAFANVSLETFFQKNIGSGCMACHTITQNASDFVWTLKTHALQTNGGASRFTTPEFQQLRQLIIGSTGKPK